MPKSQKKPWPSKEEQQLWDDWAQQLRSEMTRSSYEKWLRKLLNLTWPEPIGKKLTATGIVAMGQDGAVPIWIAAKKAVLKLKPTGQHIALNALKNFMRSNGIFPPADRVPLPERVKDIVDMPWLEAAKIIDSADPPYNFIFKLMLHCAWGNHEFLTFNTAEHWQKAKAHIEEKLDASYFRYNFPKRKTNPLPYYTLIPRFLLTEILAASVTLPLETPIKHIKLDMQNYLSASTYLQKAFRKAKNRANVQNAAGPHDLRDTFDTFGGTHGISYESREFAMGHGLDPRMYDKCWNNEPWQWKQLNAIYTADKTENY